MGASGWSDPKNEREIIPTCEKKFYFVG